MQLRQATFAFAAMLGAASAGLMEGPRGELSAFALKGSVGRQSGGVSGLTMLRATEARLVPAQAPGVTRLHTPETRFSRPFSDVTGLRELSDGRVMLLDAGDQGVLLINAQLSDAKAVGRQGSGPGEYVRPTLLIALPDDRTAILDWGSSRLLTVSADGIPRGVMPASTRCDGDPTRYPLFLAADREGRFYSEGGFSPPTGPLGPTSTVVIRWRARCSGDTVATFTPAARRLETTAFLSVTQWVTGEDGTVAVLHAAPYGVSFIRPDGARRDLKAIAYERIRVTDAIKEQWRKDQQVPMGVSIVYRNGNVGGGVMKKPYSEPARWPDELPPFLAGAASFGSDGNLWVRRTVKPGEPPLYDVISPDGLLARVELRPGSHVVGFGKGKVYTVWRDEDDLEYLERFAWPAR